MAEQIRLRLQAFYTLTELAKLTATSSGRVRRLLASAGIKFRRIGGQYFVFVSHIEVRLPELWDSVVTCERMHAITRSLGGA